MIDSTNVRVLADNISKLWDKIKSISVDLLPSRSTATTGQILKLTGENKTPAWADFQIPAQTDTEFFSGFTLDGKPVYGLLKTVKNLISGTNEVATVLADKVVFFSTYGIRSSNVAGIITNINFQIDTGRVYVTLAADSAYIGGTLVFFVFYTKPDPTPGDAKGPVDSDQEAEPEPEEKKTTKKKSSK